MELLLFPVELIHRISSYLSADDILSLSLTCHHLRNVLNDNFIWKRYIPEVDLSGLDSLEQKVEPHFQPPPSLTPLCCNRLYYMKKVHILNNWRQGNFKDHILQDTGGSTFIPGGIRSTIRSKEQLIYNDNYLFLSAYFGSFESIEMWKIENEPEIHSSIQFSSLLFDEYFQIVGSHLVFLGACKVSVFGIKIQEKRFPLLHSFFVHKDEVYYGTSGRNVIHDVSRLGWCHYTAGQKLVSIRHGETIFHIWEITEPKKVGTFNLLSLFFKPEDLPPWNRNVLSVECSNNDDIILSTYLPIESTFFVGFNLAKKDFSGFEVVKSSVVSLVLFDGVFVIVFTQTSEEDFSKRNTICTLYDYNTSQRLKEKFLNDAGTNGGVKKTKIVNGKFVVLCADSLEVIDVKTLDTISVVNCDSQLHCLSITQTLDLLGSIFVVVCNEEFQLEIWDIKNKKKCSDQILSGKHSESRIFCNSYCTKMVCFDWVVGSIIVFNLW